VDRLNNKWLFAFFVILAVLVSFFFIKWLYIPDTYASMSISDMSINDSNSTDNLEVFSYDIEKRLKLEQYSNNLFIQLLNTVITSAKVNYENEYGCPMPGLLASTASSITDGLHTDISNPITYLNIAFTAFSQYNPYAFARDGINDNVSGYNVAPDITNYDNAPEGAIFFSEEDEYKAEGLLPGQQSSNPASIQNPLIAEETVGIPGKIAMDMKSPQILIYHSHSTESYMPNTAGNYHTLNERYNVVSVGNTITKELQDKYKYKVLHDKTAHDKVSYAYSYANSLVTIKNSIKSFFALSVISVLKCIS